MVSLKMKMTEEKEAMKYGRHMAYIADREKVSELSSLLWVTLFAPILSRGELAAEAWKTKGSYERGFNPTT